MCCTPESRAKACLFLNDFVFHNSLRCIFILNCIYALVGACDCRCLQKPEEGLRPHGAGVTGRFDPPNIGTRSQIRVLCQSRTCIIAEPSLRLQQK